MYRNRNLDIALAAIIAILGGFAAAKHLPGQVTIPLGIGLFFAPGYLWSEAILNQRLSGIERTMTSAGMALIFPILGGFLFFALRIPLLKSSWIGLLVVLTLLGVVAVAVQRLREAPVDRRQYERQQHSRTAAAAAGRPDGPARLPLRPCRDDRHRLRRVFRQERRGAEISRPQSALSMAPIVPGAQSFVGTSASSSPNPAAATSTATQAHLDVSDYEGVAEQYQVQALRRRARLPTRGPLRSLTTSRGRSLSRTRRITIRCWATFTCCRTPPRPTLTSTTVNSESANFIGSFLGAGLEMGATVTHEKEPASTPQVGGL